MTTLTVDINNDQEERVLLAFLNSLKYNYHTNADGPIGSTKAGSVKKATSLQNRRNESRTLQRS